MIVIKYITLLFVFFSFNLQANYQVKKNQVKSHLIDSNTVDSIFSDSLKKTLNIDFDIYRVYKYEDKLGVGFIVLTENKYKIEKKNTLIDSIKAFNFRLKENKFILKWSFQDFYLIKGNSVSEEYSIWFWTKYFILDDFDEDGIIDPIIAYGTKGMNNYDDGRIKILIYYKGKKRAIRHQNGTLDSERNTQVDKKYYHLPKKIQMQVLSIMDSMMKNNHAIFPYGWKENMEEKKTQFDEN